jgi:histidine phosphotransferase ChpT
MPKNRVKLLLNLILLANAAVPRGGKIAVAVDGDVNAPRFLIRCTGPSARVPPAFEKLVPGDVEPASIDAHAVQGYYAGALARAVGMTVSARLDGEDVIVEAVPSVMQASAAA